MFELSEDNEFVCGNLLVEYPEETIDESRLDGGVENTEVINLYY